MQSARRIIGSHFAVPETNAPKKKKNKKRRLEIIGSGWPPGRARGTCITNYCLRRVINVNLPAEKDASTLSSPGNTGSGIGRLRWGRYRQIHGTKRDREPGGGSWKKFVEWLRAFLVWQNQLSADPKPTESLDVIIRMTTYWFCFHALWSRRLNTWTDAESTKGLGEVLACSADWLHCDSEMQS